MEFEKKSIMKENVKVRGFETICENSEKEQRKNKSRKKSVILMNNGLFLVGEDGFEPSKRNAADLQSVPFGHSGTPPDMKFCFV